MKKTIIKYPGPHVEISQIKLQPPLPIWNDIENYTLKEVHNFYNIYPCITGDYHIKINIDTKRAYLFKGHYEMNPIETKLECLATIKSTYKLDFVDSYSSLHMLLYQFRKNFEEGSWEYDKITEFIHRRKEFELLYEKENRKIAKERGAIHDC